MGVGPLNIPYKRYSLGSTLFVTRQEVVLENNLAQKYCEHCNAPSNVEEGKKSSPEKAFCHNMLM